MNTKLIGIFVFLLLFSSVVLPVSGDITIWKKKLVEKRIAFIEVSEVSYESKNKDVNYHYRYMTEDGKIHTVTKSRIELFAELANNLEKNDTSNIIIENSEGNHPPIYINGNDDFTPENGITGGSGTEEDPFIISDWVIEGHGNYSNGIIILNTDAYFIIGNCSVNTFFREKYAGIAFINVINGKIEGSEIFSNYYGIYLDNCYYIDIVDCLSYKNHGLYSAGIVCLESQSINISNCDISDTYGSPDSELYGIFSYGSAYITLENSNVYKNKGAGILIYKYDENHSAGHNAISKCKIFDNNGGIWVYESFSKKAAGYNRITDCEIFNNDLYNPETDQSGIFIYTTGDNLIEKCHIYDNYQGLTLYASSNNIIRNCTIHNNGKFAQVNPVGGIKIEGGVWIDYEIPKYNLIEHCDIYDENLAIQCWSTSRTTIHYNNIFNSSLAGININWIDPWISTASIKYNNFINNSIDETYLWNKAVFCSVSIVDARNNWWDSSRGPRTRLFPFRPGNSLWQMASFVLFRPWAKEPISDAGVQ